MKNSVYLFATCDSFCTDVAQMSQNRLTTKQEANSWRAVPCKGVINMFPGMPALDIGAYANYKMQTTWWVVCVEDPCFACEAWPHGTTGFRENPAAGTILMLVARDIEGWWGKSTMGTLLAKSPLEVSAINYNILEPNSSGIENALVLTDGFTKFTQVISTKDQKTRTVAKVLVNDWFKCYSACHNVSTATNNADKTFCMLARDVRPYTHHLLSSLELFSIFTDSHIY